jgi:hypothetical protein
MDLRPLGFGEIFDRAVTLYIRNFVPFAAIVMVLILPSAVLQYLIDRASQPEFAALIRIVQHPEAARTQPMPSAFNSPLFVVVFAALLLLTYVIWPFALNAVAVGVARLYRNRPVEFAACYEVVLRRWRQILGLVAIDFIVLLGWYVAAVIVVVILAVAISAFATISPQFVFLFGFVVGIVGIIALLPSVAPLIVALTFAMYAVVIEERGAIESLVLGFVRVFNRKEFWRAVLFSLAAGAVVVAGSSVFSLLGMFAAFAHLPSVEAIVESLGRAIVAPFGVVLLAIYYFDVRIRREAFDLEASLERLTAAQPA